ncbi:snRNA transcription factor [Heracleum sosnowskyi]|uniref:snRNA transcription factor n=1 Tax=Heracleum sosnowskyi TaxID=360622 RepID=A0AAD8IWM8_9APIA|nr:snRNA transcription factor [Heracleum sosnowskyi]
MAETNGESEIGKGSYFIERNNNNNIYQFIPRGGPLYVANLVSSLTKPPLFQSHLLSELQDLREELGQEFSDISEDDDLSVDELKIVTEEELVDKAFDIAFNDDQVRQQEEELVDKVAFNNDQVPKLFPEEELVDKAFDNEITGSGKLSELRNNAVTESSKGGISGRLYDFVKKKKGKKQKYCRNNDKKRKRDDGDKRRKRKKRKEESVGESYLADVKQLVRIKEKQIEDKAAARLHSFDGSSRINDNAMILSERTGRSNISLTSDNSAAKARILSSHERQVLEPGKEVVLCVEVYHNQRTWQKTQEFLVLGRQSLSELRDKIYCLTDKLMETAGQRDTSGYFLVEDVFYNDLRDASAIDYSKPILDWLEDSKKEAHEKWEYILSGKLQPKQKALMDNKNKENLPQFKACEMHEKQFCDLNFRLGAEYLYCHQGDCQHTIVIRDMRLIHPEDIQDRCAYPVVTFQFKPRIRKCSVCQIFRAKLVTVDDKWAGENPCYFCDICYYMLHYANESLLYPDFSVYDYQHDQI